MSKPERSLQLWLPSLAHVEPTHPLRAWLPRADRLLLSVTRWLVPSADREDWLRSWQAELWHRSHLNAHRADLIPHRETGHPAPALFFGILQDALWLRTDTVSRALTGTPALCILLLASLLLLATIPAVRHAVRYRPTSQRPT